MNAKELILKKREGGALTEAEIRHLVSGAVDGSIEPYHLTAWLMAVFFQNMNREETAFLTRAMIDSGRRIELGDLERLPVDKHSTGGVGDKLSFLVAPIAAAHGVPVPMISGRSLGHTGGTLDKLESIAGYRTGLSAEEFTAQVRRTGICLAGQSEDLVPADRLFYSLRDAASIVESIPLITASILSKKAAEGARGLVLDVKVGDGAFMGTLDEGRDLARSLVETAALLGLRAHAFLTRMDYMLGRAAGNALEIRESVEGMRSGRLPPDLDELTQALAGEMLHLGGVASNQEEGRKLAQSTLSSGRAFEVFRALVRDHGGEIEMIDDTGKLPTSSRVVACQAEQSGTFTGLRARAVGEWITRMGGGRLRAGDPIDPVVGVETVVDPGDQVKAGDTLLQLHLPDDPKRGSEDAARSAAATWPVFEGETTGSRYVLEELNSESA